ncbi:MAG: aminotransferase [Proteobacteria bacterium]|nr:aminotransferase [Pseudomonadota bacterium]
MSQEPARNLSLEEMDKQSSLHPFTALDLHMKTGPRIIASGKGVRVTDTNGNELLDAMAGLWCVNIGYGREEIADAVAEQIRKLSYFHSFASMANEPAIRLADRLIGLAPDNMSKVFFGNTGSDANDTQIKLVWYYNNVRGKTKKKKIIARKRAYHGVTVISGGLTGLDLLHTGFDLPLARVVRTDTPSYYWGAEAGSSERDFSKELARRLDSLIEAEGPDTIAAFIAEPIMGAGGVIVPPEGYFEEIQKVLKKHDVLLIADEVITGFGRLGTWFGTNALGLEPDLMSCAKGLTSAYVPMSACIISEPIWQALLEGAEKFGPFGHGYTYSAHPVAATTAMVNLDIIEREDLVGNAGRVGAYLQKRLRESFAEHPLVGEVRGMGLIAAIELVADKANKKPFDLGLKVAYRMMGKCLEEGLISRSLVQTNSLGFSPPLVLTEAEVDEIVDKFGRALATLSDELKADGIWAG